MTRMTVRELIAQEIDVDVYDDVCEEISIAFTGPMKLTKEGRKHFAPVLDFKVSLDRDEDIATVLIETDDWEKRLAQAKEFFVAAAGLCSEENYEKWFKE